jgi:sulfatase-modifying factor enzyme 1
MREHMGGGEVLRRSGGSKLRFWTSAGVGALAFTLASRAFAVCAAPGDADCVQRRSTFTGTVDFFATGASFAAVDNPDDDRPGKLVAVATVSVPERRIPGRAKLRQAFIYFGGSLFQDNDGNDTPDTEVELQVPGTSTYATVRGEIVHQSEPIPGFQEATLYAVKADITDLIQSAGGMMVGTYRVKGFKADIFYGMERHTVANASFSIVLIFEEERLPPRQIVLFDGEQLVFGSTVSLDLSGFLVSPVPSGSLTFYAQEGDCNPGPKDCAHGNDLSGAEHIRVTGTSPERTLLLQDQLNPPNDIFNRTINTVDPQLTNVPGTDIDTFDVSSILRPADTHVSVELTSPRAERGNSGDLVGLVYVIVGIDVFAPELRVDSRIDISTDKGEKLEKFLPGDPLRVVYALSNTGNLPGTEVHLEAEMPANVVSFAVERPPEGDAVTVMSDPKGGAAQRGKVVADHIRIRHGEVNSLVLTVVTTCPLSKDDKLVLSADVGAPKEGGDAFTMTSSVVLAARDKCGPNFYLYGGGGCTEVHPTRTRAPWILIAVSLIAIVALAIRVRRGLIFGLTILGTLTFGSSCGGDKLQPDRPPPDPIGMGCFDFDDMVVVPEARGLPSFCIDRYEASIFSGDLGNATQSGDGDGSTSAVAQSERFVQPLHGVSWYQARAACANAQKRLCSAEEWTRACRGDGDTTYPYGDAYQPTTCNGYQATRGAPVETGAMIVPVPLMDGTIEAHGCVSQDGAYDMSGNVWEWNSTSYFQGARRGLAGGSFRSNKIGLRCVTEDNHAAPDDHDETYGFRCCIDLP